MFRDCPTHGLDNWTMPHAIYVGLNHLSKKLLDSVVGGTFMTRKQAQTKNLLDNMMTNYAQWHTESAPTTKVVNSIEEIGS